MIFFYEVFIEDIIMKNLVANRQIDKHEQIPLDLNIDK